MSSENEAALSQGAVLCVGSDCDRASKTSFCFCMTARVEWLGWLGAGRVSLPLALSASVAWGSAQHEGLQVVSCYLGLLPAVRGLGAVYREPQSVPQGP